MGEAVSKGLAGVGAVCGVRDCDVNIFWELRV